MLRCIFGICSSETYVVNQLPNEQLRKTGGALNGVTKITPLRPEPSSPTTNGNQNEQISTEFRQTASAPYHNSVAVKKTPAEVISPEKLPKVTESKENKLVTGNSYQRNEQIVIEIDNKTSPEVVFTQTQSSLQKLPEATAINENKLVSHNSYQKDEQIVIQNDNKVTGTKTPLGVDFTQTSPSQKLPEATEIGENKSVSHNLYQKDEQIVIQNDDKIIGTKTSPGVAFTQTQASPQKLPKATEIKKNKRESDNLHQRDEQIISQIENEITDPQSTPKTIKATKSNDKKVIVKKDTNVVISKSNVIETKKEEIVGTKEKDPSKEIEEEDTSKETEERDSAEKEEDKDSNDEIPVKKDVRKVRINIEDTTTKEQTSSKDENGDDIPDISEQPVKRRSGVVPVKYETTNAALPNYPKDPEDEALIRKAIESNDFLSKIISGKRLDDIIQCMYNREVSAKENIIKQGEKGSHMFVSAKGKYQVLVKGKPVSEFSDVRVFGELAILYNAKRLATIKALSPGRIWVLNRSVYQQIMVQYNIKEQDEIMEFLMKNKKLNVVGKDALQEVANLLKSEFFSAGKQIVRQGDKGYKFYIIRAGTVTITKDGEGKVGNCEKGDCFGELALLKEDCRQATVTADAPGVECLTLTRKEFIDHFGELKDLTDLKVRPPPDSIKEIIAEHEDIHLTDLKILKTLGVGGFGRVELVQHTKKKDLVFALKYLKKKDIVLQHQQEHVYNEKNIQMASRSPFIVRLYRTYKDSKYIYFLMESCLGGDLWTLLQKQKLRRFEEKEARFIAACVLEAFEYLHSRAIIYRDLKPENLLIAINGYIKLTDFGFAKKISSRGRTFTFAGTPEYVAPEIVLNKGHDRAVDYWAFGAFIFELLTGRTPFRTDDSSHMKTYNKILNGIDNVQFPSYVNSKARHIIEKLCRPVPSERLGMQRGGIKDIKTHKWFLGFDWMKFGKCEISPPFKPKLKSSIDTQNFDHFKKDTDIPPDENSGWDVTF